MKRLLACALVALSLVSVMSFGRRGRGYGRGGRGRGWVGRGRGWGGRGGWYGRRWGYRPWIGAAFWGPRYRSFPHYCEIHPNDPRCIEYRIFD